MLISSKLHRACFSGVLQGKKPVKLLHEVYRKFMRRCILLGESGAQVGDEFTVLLVLMQLLPVLLLSVARRCVLCCVEHGEIFYLVRVDTCSVFLF